MLSRIESHEDCRNLPMISFLILPMQRVTRLPLLMDVRTEILFFICILCPWKLSNLSFFSYWPIPTLLCLDWSHKLVCQQQRGNCEVDSGIYLHLH